METVQFFTNIRGLAEQLEVSKNFLHKVHLKSIDYVNDILPKRFEKQARKNVFNVSSLKPSLDIQSSEFNIIKDTRDETDLDLSTFFTVMMNFKKNTYILLLNCFSFRIHVPSNRLSNDDICPHENETITLKSFCQMMLVIFLSSLICAGLLFICILVR